MLFDKQILILFFPIQTLFIVFFVNKLGFNLKQVLTFEREKDSKKQFCFVQVYFNISQQNNMVSWRILHPFCLKLIPEMNRREL